MRALARALAALALAGLPAACGEAPSDPEAAGDCPAGQVRVEGICIDDKVNHSLISLQIRPPAESGLLIQQYDRIRLSDRMGRRLPDVVLERDVRFSGTVTLPFVSTATGLAAQVVLKRRGVIPGTWLRYEALAPPGAAGYSMRVLPGTYDLAIFPEKSGLPPFKESGFRIEQDTQRLIVLPAEDAYFSLTGRVVIDDRMKQPVSSFSVQAFGEGLTQLSTRGVTDAEGSFTIRLPPVDETYTLHLTPPEEQAFYPSVTMSGISVSADAVDDSGSLDLGDLPLGAGAQGPIDLCGTIVSGLTCNSGLVVGAAVELSADVGNGRFSPPPPQTDELGRFRVPVLPGDYTLRIVPSGDDDRNAVTHLNLVVDAEAATRTPECEGIDVGRIELDCKATVEGRATTAAGEPVPEATVESLLVGNGEVRDLRRLSLAYTDVDGQYTLSVDPGLHDITTIPPERSGQPRSLECAVPLSEDTSNRLLPLDQPDVMAGVVRNPDFVPLAGATVEVHLHNPCGDDEDRVALMGVGTTDADGRYSIVLPNP